MIIVRPAQCADADALLALIDALADYEKLERPTLEARARLVRDGFDLAVPRFSVLMAHDEEGRAVAYSIFFETYSSFLAKPTLYIEDIFVRPDARRQGAGDALFRELCAEAARRDCGRMEWMCLNWNELAAGFYEKRGGGVLDEWRYYRLTESEFQRASGNGGASS